MPVEDHAVHDKVKVAADKPYGCHSRGEFSKGYFAPDRVYRPNGTYYVRIVPVPYAMSTACRNFYLWDTDPRCARCTAERDDEYADRMRGLK